MITLSKSGYEKYLQCPKSFDFHYNHRLRATISSSELVFGAAVDSAFNAILLRQGDPFAIFEKSLYVPEMVIFRNDDFDVDLLSEEEMLAVNTKEMTKIFFKQQFNGFGKLSQVERELLKKWCLLSLHRKGILIINKFIGTILPKIKTVYDVQKEATFALPSGNQVKAVMDMGVELEGVGRVLIDNKTTKRPYLPESVRDSFQLNLYAKIFGYDKIGYITFNKTINKTKNKVCRSCGHSSEGKHLLCDNVIDGLRCRGQWETDVTYDVDVQILIGDVNKETQDKAFSSFEQAIRAIEVNAFPMNTGACRFMFGRECPYMQKCWENKEDNLIKKEE